MDILTLNSESPFAFRQPFLVLYFGNAGRDFKSPLWYIEVGGGIDRYLKDYMAVRDAYLALTPAGRKARGLPGMPCNIIGDASDWKSQATPLLSGILARFENLGFPVKRVFGYEGSGGPSHVLVNGALFQRMDVEEFQEDVHRRRTEGEAGEAEAAGVQAAEMDVANLIPKILGPAAA